MDDDIILSIELLKVGLVMIDEIIMVVIGDYVWLDVNNNGCQDVGEILIVGVQVSLYDVVENFVVLGGLLFIIIINVDGYYCFLGLQFNIDYYVCLDNDVDYVSGGCLLFYMLIIIDVVGVNDELDLDVVLGIFMGFFVILCFQIYFLIGGVEMEIKIYDFGFFCLGSISGIVWMDSDNGGDKDGNEMVFSGILVFLYDVVIDVVIFGLIFMDVFGNFLFIGVFLGIYYLFFLVFFFGKIFIYKDLMGNDNNDLDVGSIG